MESGTEIKNRIEVENEHEIGIKIKSVTEIGIKSETGLEQSQAWSYSSIDTKDEKNHLCLHLWSWGIANMCKPPTRKVGRDESDDKSDDLIASPSAAGRHMRVPTARDMRYGRRLVEVVSA
ncbi:hypothetical protein EVAR_6564_1 [Eumeta japonica]|uniref:Uncharacterized protein n=1 Tax=Eumeta variegata TaxID=151549 RepID=A0A4C1SQF8_EUMVA|nr:hypothetical protein EVAR_6564_1 [Eumeta japonica]